MPKRRQQRLVMVIGEERPGSSAYAGEVIHIASPDHKWGREEKPPRFQFVNEELSIEEERDLYSSLWKRDFEKNNFVSKIESEFYWDKDQVFAYDDPPSRGGDLEEAARIIGGPEAKPEDVILKPFATKHGFKDMFDPMTLYKYKMEILKLEHKLRAVVKRDTPALDAVRKSLFFVVHQDLKWLGGVVIEGRDRGKSHRQQMLHLVENPDVKAWLSELWGMD